MLVRCKQINIPQKLMYLFSHFNMIFLKKNDVCNYVHISYRSTRHFRKMMAKLLIHFSPFLSKVLVVNSTKPQLSQPAR